jgi:hypothetical protein
MRWCEEGVEGLELPEADVEVCVDEDVRWADCAVGVTACVQPGDRRCQTVWPGDQDLTALLFGEPFERYRLICEEVVEVAICRRTGEEHADAVFFEV